MPFKFYCRNCNQKLEAPEELYGSEIECPQCEQILTVPDPRVMIEKPPEKLSDVAMACPVCGYGNLDMPAAKYGMAVCGNCKSKIPLTKPYSETTSVLPVLEEYYIVRKLGKGGTGSVFEARQVKLDNRSVAIKILSKELSANWDISREVSALVRLSHPYIVRIFDIAHTDDLKGIVMELIMAPHCESLSLRDILNANNGTLPLEAAVKTAQTICNALAYAHRQNVLHLDLKPENILVDHLGMLRIVDFGIAKLHEPKPSVNSQIKIKLKSMPESEIFGTPGYIAPERRDPDSRATPATDVFSLGAILYEMLIGEVPAGHFQLPSEIDRKMPKELDAIIESSLNFHVDKRYKSMVEFGDALNNALKVIRAGGDVSGKYDSAEISHTTGTNTMRIKRPDLTLSTGFDFPLGKDEVAPRKKFGAVTYMLIGMLCAFVTVVVTLALIKPSDDQEEHTEVIAVTPGPKTVSPSPDIAKAPAVVKPETVKNAPAPVASGEELYAGYQKLFWGSGIKRDEVKAFVLLKNASDMKYPPAMNRLGEMFFYEEGGFKDPARALQLFRMAAEKSNAKALFNLGECFYYGMCGLEKSYQKAVEYYTNAMSLGSREATYALGRCYQRGTGVKKSDTRAQLLFRQAAAEGYAPAREIVRLSENGSTNK